MSELRNAPDATLADDSLFPVAEPASEGTGVRKATGAQLKEFIGGAVFPPLEDNAGKALLVNNDEDGVLWGTVATEGGGGDEESISHYRKLASLDLSGKTNVSFDNIPQDGQGLRLVVTGCMNTGGGNLNVRINGNTQGIYDAQRIFANRGVDANTAQDDWQSEDAWRRLSTFGTGGATSFAELEILNYADTANPKSAKGSGRQPSTASRAYYLVWALQARTNDAVTSLQVGNDEGNTFAPGSRATLYIIGSDGLQPEKGIPAEYGGDAMSGWRRTADGWLEQWGQISGNTDVVFLKPFDTVFSLQGNCSGFLDDVGGYNGTFNYHSLTALGFKARPRATTNGNAFTPGEPFKWRAIGRVAPKGIDDGARAKYRIGGFFVATPTASEVVLLHVAAEDFGLMALFAGSQVNVGTAPSGPVTFTIARNGVAIGTMVIAVDKSVTFTGDGVLVSAGDLISVTAPADSLGVANVAFTFKAV